MTEHENGQQLEAKSSIKLTLNAKGEAQVSVSVYEGCDPVELTRIRELAVEQFHRTLEAVGRR